jgi:hypothetical protein
LGLLHDIVDLAEVRLKDRSFYISIDGTNSVLLDLLIGTVQGLILGPVLCANFVSPLFDIKLLSAKMGHILTKPNLRRGKFLGGYHKEFQGCT